MGIQYRVHCPNCTYEKCIDFGFGFLYPDLYRETIQKMREGSLGTEAQEFILQYPYGGVDCEYVALRCEQCKRLDSDLDLSMYIPKGNYVSEEKRENGRYTQAMLDPKEDYKMPCELQVHFELFRKYDHRCKFCNGKMQIMKEPQFLQEEITCPECGSKLEKVPSMDWD